MKGKIEQIKYVPEGKQLIVICRPPGRPSPKVPHQKKDLDQLRAEAKKYKHLRLGKINFEYDKV